MMEEDAKKRWCPFVRVGGGAINRTGPLADFNCIASKCAAWRWLPPNKKMFVKATGKPIESDRTYEIAHLEERDVSSGEGYCGLAGNSGMTERPAIKAGE